MSTIEELIEDIDEQHKKHLRCSDTYYITQLLRTATQQQDPFQSLLGIVDSSLENRKLEIWKKENEVVDKQNSATLELASSINRLANVIEKIFEFELKEIE